MSEVKTYAVNCNDAWLNTDGDDISGSYVKYADYMALAAKLDIAEFACAEMAAENAGMKSAIPDPLDIEYDNDNMDDVSLAEDVGFNYAVERMRRQIPETPTTDAFLAEVRAQGVEMFAQWCRGERDFTLIDEDVADAAAYEECIKRAEYFAAQLRKEGEQK